MNDTSKENPSQNTYELSEATFTEKLWANPDDNSVEFLKAVHSSAEHEQQWHDARGFNQQLNNTFKLVKATPALYDKLMQIPEQTANDDSFMRRLLPVAAVMLLAISLGLYYQPGMNSDMNSELSDDLFGHIYQEEPYFGDGSVIAASEVNARIAPVMGEGLLPGAATDGLEVTFAKDCYIARQRAMHLVVKGKTGPINVVMIPSQVVKSEMQISDKRFNGLVTPASGGTLVIIGNKQEPIAAYRDRFASSLNWEY